MLRRSGRHIQFPARYRENAFITSMMNVDEPSSYREANQCSEWKTTMVHGYESILKKKNLEAG